MKPIQSRTYHDPLHGAIALDGSDPAEALIIQLIDTPAFQRLRRIRQLGPASFTFHGAEASRFTHSLGVMAVARRAFDGIVERYPSLKPHRATVLCAALLHDVGHGPFSHTAEDVFGTGHEHWTAQILQHSPPVRQLLDQFSPGLLESILQVYQHQHSVPLVWQLVSSQLDCDRLDYLMRDSYFTGAAYGQLDLDRILMAMRYDPVSQQLAVAQKGLAAIEHYLMVRHFMYAQVYSHPKNIAATWMLCQLFNRARSQLQSGQLDADETMRAWMQQPQQSLSLNHYLAADDMVLLYHLHRWQQHSDPVLSDLCRRYQDRNLLKAKDITHRSLADQTALLQQVYWELEQRGWLAKYYAGLQQSLSRGYTLYHHGIKVQTPSGLQELSLLSKIVHTLAQPIHRTWLIYPREVESKLTGLLRDY